MAALSLLELASISEDIETKTKREFSHTIRTKAYWQFFRHLTPFQIQHIIASSYLAQ